MRTQGTDMIVPSGGPEGGWMGSGGGPWAGADPQSVGLC